VGCIDIASADASQGPASHFRLLRKLVIQRLNCFDQELMAEKVAAMKAKQKN
jgi:hypothetical protein